MSASLRKRRNCCVEAEYREVRERDISTLRPQPRSRMPEFWQQPWRCHVCLQSQMRRSRLQLPVFPRLWPRFRCEGQFPDNKQRPEGAAKMHGFVRLSSRSPLGRNLPPPGHYGSVPYRGSRAACVPESAADRSEKSFREHSSHHPQIHPPFCGERTSAVTIWPRSNACRVSCVPVRPVAPRINSRIVRSNIKIAGGSALGCLTMMTRPPGLQIANPYLTRVIELNARNNHSMHDQTRVTVNDRTRPI
jgi:hypothetical protein